MFQVWAILSLRVVLSTKLVVFKCYRYGSKIGLGPKIIKVKCLFVQDSIGKSVDLADTIFVQNQSAI